MVNPSNCRRLTIFGSSKWLRGFLLWALFKDGNLIGSLMKNVGLGCQNKSSIKYRTYRIVQHPVLISLISIHLHSEAMDITDCICRATLRTNSRNTQEDVCLFSCGVEEAGGCDIRAFLGAFEYTVRSLVILTDVFRYFAGNIAYPAALAWTTLEWSDFPLIYAW